MDLGLDGKVAVVTGASKGIGRAIVEGLVREGAHVIAGARTFDHELRALPGVDAVEVDLARPDGPAALIEHAGELDVLVNNFGSFEARLEGFESISDEDWVRSLELNVLSAVRATRAAIPKLVRGGAIVNVSSINGRVPMTIVTDYAASKAALTNVSKVLAEELAAKGIRVNTVSPGPTRTPAWEEGDFGRALASGSGIGVEELLEQMPDQAGMTIGRILEPGDVADLVVFLASDRAAGVTGADYVVDGGLAKTV
jgi:putative oxidoreductase